VALTHVVIRNLVVCRVLNDGFNLHGTTSDLRLENIAAVDCGDDGISPHETCEVTIDGYWGVGNSTGMGNGNLSVTRAWNVRLEGNLGHQLMTGHAPVTELRHAIIVAAPGTGPVNVTNSQATIIRFENVRISAPADQEIAIAPNTGIQARRVTVVGPTWVNAGKVRIEASVIAGAVALRDGGSWEGTGNVWATGSTPPPGDADPVFRTFGSGILGLPGAPFEGLPAGADLTGARIPPIPRPHAGAGRFPSLEAIGGK
jgi:hypothetical protein